MTSAKTTAFFELLHEIISGPGSWIEKRDNLLADAGPDDRMNLEEFAIWFAPEDRA